METTTYAHRGIREGVLAGLAAGVLFVVVEVLVSAVTNNAPLMPFRLFASVLLGGAALQTTPLGAAFVVGTVVHLTLSALFGLLYALINVRLSGRSQTEWGRQAGLGVLFGAALWLVNFQIIARVIYPWFLTPAQFAQLLIHAACYGLPLGLLFAAAERRVHRLGHPTTA